MLLGNSSSYVNVINCKFYSEGGFNVIGKYVDCLSTSQGAFLANNSKYFTVTPTVDDGINPYIV